MVASKIVPATLAFSGTTPYSPSYRDVYHSAEGGPGQARHVFLDGCGLPDAWRDRAVFTILETGFGTGLNFLTTWQEWRTDPRRPSRLHFLSVEKHPFAPGDLAQLHAAWPEFAPLSTELIESWPSLVPGFHRLELEAGRIQLTLMLGDARDCLPQLDARVDAFYLDGFAPDRNADLWADNIFSEVARLASPGARAATYSVAADVRTALAGAGFACTKRIGYGRKRHCLAATSAMARPPRVPAPRRVVVIGGGVAGCAAAHALAKRSIEVTVFEGESAVARAASGNPAAVFRPVISREEHPGLRLTRAAFIHDLGMWPKLGGAVESSRCGVLHLSRDAAYASRQSEVLEHGLLPAGFARWVEADEADALAGWPVGRPGVYYPEAGWVVPSSLCDAWLDDPRIVVRCGCSVGRVARSDDVWEVFDAHGNRLAEADAVVLANARDAINLVPEQNWPIQTVRGQITRLPHGRLQSVMRVIASEGYLSPTLEGRIIVGATYDHDTADVRPWPQSDLANLERLESILPGAASGLGAEVLEGRASLRAVLPDRLPLLGPVEGSPGLYVAAGYASRGVVWAGLLGETLASMILRDPLPLERDLVEALSPSRFRKCFDARG